MVPDTISLPNSALIAIMRLIMVAVVLGQKQPIVFGDLRALSLPVNTHTTVNGLMYPTSAEMLINRESFT